MRPRTIRIVAFAVLLFLLGSGIVWWKSRRHRRLEACLSNFFPMSPPPYNPSLGRTYSTNFPNSENAISENHNWVNGGNCGDSALCPGGNGSNIQSIPGLAFGTQSGAEPPPYNDSGALLTGSWGSDQFVQIVVWWDGAPGTDSDYDEVEIRLRGTFAKNWSRFYNINCRVGTPSQNSYISVGRANGPPDDFTPPIAMLRGPDAACRNGDLITGTIVGDVITAYINGKRVIQGEDSVINSGSPGFGFFHQGTHAQNKDFGVSSFFASDLFPRFVGLGRVESPAISVPKDQAK